LQPPGQRGIREGLRDEELKECMVSVAALDGRVLVLNKLYMAVHIVSVRRALSLLYKRTAEVVSIEDDRYTGYNFESWLEVSEAKRRFEAQRYEPDDWIRGVSFELIVPRIIRLLVYDKLPATEVKFNRRNIYARDSNRCQYCGRRFPTSELTLDHIVPRSRGGESTWTNTVCACVACNVRKGGRPPWEAAMKLIRKPTKPRRSPVVKLHLRNEKYRSWKQFLDAAYWSVELK
jgi:5-methylcytosine-specific restriction endonuclease McrA